VPHPTQLQESPDAPPFALVRIGAVYRDAHRAFSVGARIGQSMHIDSHFICSFGRDFNWSNSKEMHI